MDQLSALPAKFAAGATVKYTRSYSDHHSQQGWSVALHIRGEVTRDFTGSPNADGSFTFTLPATGAVSTEAMPAGGYRWEERATKAGEGTFVAAKGQVVVTPNFATAAAGALQSENEIILAKLKASLKSQVEDDILDYQIAGRAIRMISPSEKLRLIAYYEAKVRAERNPGQFSTPIRTQYLGGVRP